MIQLHSLFKEDAVTKDTLRDLFVVELKDMYDAELQLARVLPKMAKAANSKELATALQTHHRQTEEHAVRLERILEFVGETAERKSCKAMMELLEGAQELARWDGPPSVKDAALIAAAQKVEHYEIATYGCLRTWADLLNEVQASKLLQKTLDEEGAADQTLTEIAKSICGGMGEREFERSEEKVAPARY